MSELPEDGEVDLATALKNVDLKIRKLLDSRDDSFPAPEADDREALQKLFRLLDSRPAPAPGREALQKLVRELRDLEAEQNVIFAELGIGRENSAVKAEWPTDAEVVDSLLAAPPSFWCDYNLKLTELRAAVEELEALMKDDGNRVAQAIRGAPPASD